MEKNNDNHGKGTGIRHLTTVRKKKKAIKKFHWEQEKNPFVKPKKLIQISIYDEMQPTVKCNILLSSGG